MSAVRRWPVASVAFDAWCEQVPVAVMTWWSSLSVPIEWFASSGCCCWPYDESTVCAWVRRDVACPDSYGMLRDEFSSKCQRRTVNSSLSWCAANRFCIAWRMHWPAGHWRTAKRMSNLIRISSILNARGRIEPAKTQWSSSMCDGTASAVATVPFLTWCLWWTGPTMTMITAPQFRRTDPMRTQSTSGTPCGNVPLAWSAHFAHYSAHKCWCCRSTWDIRPVCSSSFLHRIGFSRPTGPLAGCDATIRESTNSILRVCTWLSRMEYLFSPNQTHFHSLHTHNSRYFDQQNIFVPKFDEKTNCLIPKTYEFERNSLWHALFRWNNVSHVKSSIELIRKSVNFRTNRARTNATCWCVNIVRYTLNTP